MKILVILIYKLYLVDSLLRLFYCIGSPSISLLFLNWSILDLQCCVNFFCTANQFSYTHTHTYVYICSFPLWFNLSQASEYNSLCWTVGPCPYISICNNLHLLTPNSHSIPPPLPAPLVTTGRFSVSVSLFLLCRKVHLCRILDSTYKWYHTVFVLPPFLFFPLCNVFVEETGSHNIFHILDFVGCSPMMSFNMFLGLRYFLLA